MFGSSRDVSLIRHLNRELLGNIITQQAAFYKYKLQETKVNLYGEAAGVKYYDGPFLFNCLIERADPEYPITDLGIEFQQGVTFAFFRDDIVDAGKNPDYPNNTNPLNPGLEEFGSNISIVCDTYYIPADKVAISPYKERT